MGRHDRAHLRDGDSADGDHGILVRRHRHADIEWADDFRVEMEERREEKDALRDARQEEELERENALAIERQKRRQERLQSRRKSRRPPRKRPMKEEKTAHSGTEEIRQAFEAGTTEDAPQRRKRLGGRTSRR